MDGKIVQKSLYWYGKITVDPLFGVGEERGCSEWPGPAIEKKKKNIHLKSILHANANRWACVCLQVQWECRSLQDRLHNLVWYNNYINLHTWAVGKVYIPNTPCRKFSKFGHLRGYCFSVSQWEATLLVKYPQISKPSEIYLLLGPHNITYI